MSALEGVRSRLEPDRRLLYAVLLGSALLFPLAFANNSYAMFIGSTFLVAALYGVAYDLLYGYTGLLSLGHAVFFGVGAYAVVFAIREFNLGLLMALVAALVVTALVAVLLGVILRISHLIHAFVIITILVALIVELWASSASELTGGTDGLNLVISEAGLFGAVPFQPYDPVTRYYLVGAFLLLSFFVLYRLVNSPVGLVFEMIRENEERARTLGYNVKAYKYLAFVVSGAFTGLAGALETYVVGHVSASQFSIFVSADPLVYTLIGGRGTLVGPIIGAGIVTIASDQIRSITDAWPLFVGLILITVAVVEPEGIMGLRERVSGAEVFDRFRGTPDDADTVTSDGGEPNDK